MINEVDTCGIDDGTPSMAIPRRRGRNLLFATNHLGGGRASVAGV